MMTTGDAAQEHGNRQEHGDQEPAEAPVASETPVSDTPISDAEVPQDATVENAGEAPPETPPEASAEHPAEIDVSSPAKVMRIGTMVKLLLEEVRSTDLDEKGRDRLAKIHRRSIEELEDGLSKELIDELERLDLPFDTSDGPPTTSELRIAQAQLVGWLEGLFHGIQTAIMAQQAMAKQGFAAHPQLPSGTMQPGDAHQTEDEDHGTGNYL